MVGVKKVGTFMGSNLLKCIWFIFLSMVIIWVAITFFKLKESIIQTRLVPMVTCSW